MNAAPPQLLFNHLFALYSVFLLFKHA
jgi:hypothetical protein